MSTQTKDGKRKLLYAGLAVVLVSILAAGGIFAYFTDTENISNKAHISEDLDITLEEPSWDEEQLYTFVPTQVRDKDPYIANVSKVDAWLIATVTVPVAEVEVVEAEQRKFAEERELFTFGVKTETGDVDPYHMCDGWAQLVDPFYTADKKAKTYVYYYTEPVAGEDSEPRQLFEAIQLINLCEGQPVADTDFTVDVHAYGMQLEGFEDNPVGAWEALAVQGIRTVVESEEGPANTETPSENENANAEAPADNTNTETPGA